MEVNGIVDDIIIIILMFLFGLYTVWKPVSALPFHQLLKHAVPLQYLQPAFFKVTNLMELCINSLSVSQKIDQTLSNIVISHDDDNDDEEKRMSDESKFNLHDLMVNSFPRPTGTFGTKSMVLLIRDLMLTLNAFSLPIRFVVLGIFVCI